MSTSSSGPVFWPSMAPEITELPGTRGGTHSGIDLAAKLNDPVLAAFDGVAVFVGGDGASGRLWLGDSWLYPNGQGKTVDIQRADGLISRVGHLNGYNIRQGQRVRAGDVIGYAGSTGYSTGVHIHWETRWDRAWSGGNWVDPRTFNPQVFSTPEPVVTEEEEIMSIYLEATGNSSPIDAGNPGTSRVWAGSNREIGGVTYSGVWERSEDGSVRRLFPGEWQAIQDAYAAAGRKVPFARISGNELEKMYLIKRAEPKR